MNKTLTEQQKKDLENLFTYHAPTEEQKVQYKDVRDAGKLLAETIILNTPVCPDQSAAIRYVRNAVFTANAAIATQQQEQGQKNPA